MRHPDSELAPPTRDIALNARATAPAGVDERMPHERFSPANAPETAVRGLLEDEIAAAPAAR
jgi:hypothetical protein